MEGLRLYEGKNCYQSGVDYTGRDLITQGSSHLRTDTIRKEFMDKFVIKSILTG